MKIATVSNIQNNPQQSFKAHLDVKRNAQVVFDRWGQAFQNQFVVLTGNLKDLSGCVHVSAGSKTPQGVVFNIESQISISGEQFRIKHGKALVLEGINNLEKARQLAIGIFDTIYSQAKPH